MTLAWNRYGKARVRLVKVAKRRPSHDLIDLTIDVQLEGGFGPVYDGDNALCVATDTMKNTVYALARRFAIDHVESFLSRLADHFVEKTAVTAARLTAVEQPWTRLSDHAFVQPGREHWTCVVTRDQERTTTVSGLSDLIVLKTTDSAFSGFPRDAYLGHFGDGVVDLSRRLRGLRRPPVDSRGAGRHLCRSSEPIGSAHAESDGGSGPRGVSGRERNHLVAAEPPSPAGGSEAVRPR